MALQNIQVRQGTRYNRLAIASLGLAAMALLGHVLMSVAVLAVFFGFGGLLLLLTQFFQIVQGHGPLEAGLRLLPLGPAA